MNTKRWLMTASLMARGCGATFEQLQARAALDLECQPAAISAHSVEGQTRVASGCGKQAIYVETCSVKTASWAVKTGISGRSRSAVSGRIGDYRAFGYPARAEKAALVPPTPSFATSIPRCAPQRSRS
jgi:hypothetical protein